jgi:hypothetical protein
MINLWFLSSLSFNFIHFLKNSYHILLIALTTVYFNSFIVRFLCKIK